MPFKSAKQKRWMYANKPAMARRWSAEEKAVSKSLPNGYSKASQVFVGARGTRMRKVKKPTRQVGLQIDLSDAMRTGMKAQTPGATATGPIGRRGSYGAYDPANSHQGGYLRIRKSYGYYRQTPTTRAEQRRERARNTLGSAATTGGASAGLTAALNPRGARLRPAVQMAAIGGGIGGALGASRKPRKHRTSYQPIAKMLPEPSMLHVPGSSFSKPKPKGKLKKITAGM